MTRLASLIRGAWRLIRQNPVVVLAFAVALVVMVYFGGRLIVRTVYWGDPAHRDQQIEGWITPGYVGHSWQVPKVVVFEALGLTRADEEGRPPSLDQLAQERGVPTDVLIDALRQAIAEHRDLRK